MTNVASMSVGAMWYTAAVLIASAAFIAFFMGLIQQADNNIKASWVEEEIRPAVTSICSGSTSDPLPPNGEKLNQTFDSEEMVIEERDLGDSGESEFLFNTKKDGDIQISVRIATTPSGSGYASIIGCNDVEFTGSNVNGPGSKEFKIRPDGSGGAHIEVS